MLIDIDNKELLPGSKRYSINLYPEYLANNPANQTDKHQKTKDTNIQL